MKILITGISGLLGLNAALALRGSHQVVGTYRDHPVHIDDVTSFRIDLQDSIATERILASSSPDLVIHAAGLTNVDACEASPALAYALNAESARSVAAAARRVSARLIHVSTDHLFDGEHAMSRESDLPQPLNVYAQTKLAAERLVIAEHPDALVVRTNFYGWGHPHRQSFSDWIISALRDGRTLTMFHDVYFTPILVNDLVDAMMKLAALGASGVCHVAGGERLSKHDFALALARQFTLDEGLLQPVSVSGFGFKARRPRDMSLDTTRVSTLLGHVMPNVEDGVQRLKVLESLGLPGLLERAVTIS